MASNYIPPPTKKRGAFAPTKPRERQQDGGTGRQPGCNMQGALHILQRIAIKFNITVTELCWDSVRRGLHERKGVPGHLVVMFHLKTVTTQAEYCPSYHPIRLYYPHHCYSGPVKVQLPHHHPRVVFGSAGR